MKWVLRDELPIYILIRATALEYAVELHRRGMSIRQIAKHLNESDFSCYGNFPESQIARCVAQAQGAP